MSWALYGLAVAVALIGSDLVGPRGAGSGQGAAVAAFGFATVCVIFAIAARVWGVG